MNDLSRLTSINHFCITLALTSVLVACGGGSSGPISGDLTTNRPPASSSAINSGWVAGSYKESSEFDNRCAVPRTGFSQYTNQPFPDKKGTVLDEKNFLRSWSYETYLWYEELPDLNPGSYGTPQAYFELLKTNKLTSSQTPKDNFHFWEPTEDAESSDAGISYGYGIELKVYKTTPPREYFVAYVEPDSIAARNGVRRGAKIMTIDSVSLVEDTSSSGLDTLNEGLFPSKLNVKHVFEFKYEGSDIVDKVELQSEKVETSPVLLTKVLKTETGNVGYIVFNSHIEKAQDQWVSAIQTLKQSSVTDVILDLRYNGGGLLSIASQIGYMLAGTNVQGKVFYEQILNKKQTKEDPFPFLNYGLYGNYKNLELPTLNLQRVYVLSTGGTCSASEAIINGLRGSDVQVFLIGDTTCGKPYGFYPEENCGTTYYMIQIKGANAKGFGEYSDGFIPSAQSNNETLIKGCRVQDDINSELGDTSEAMLSTALSFRANGTCPGSVSKGAQKTRASFVDGEFLEDEIRKITIIK
ncbi:MAG TPA: S41 family peptidase [Cellvibrio sp.]|nr:S41 family peptidase [Cellvibrio sp.]